MRLDVLPSRETVTVFSRLGDGLRPRVDADIRELRAEIGGLRFTLLRVGGGIIVGLVGVIAAIFVGPVGG